MTHLTPEYVNSLLEGTTPGAWAYRPDEYDDWGMVRTAPDAEGRRWVVCQARHPYSSDEQLAEHRRNKTDPWGGTARLIAETPSIARAYVALSERVGELRQAKDFADENRAFQKQRADALSEREKVKDAEIARLTGLLNNPEVEDFAKGATLEAAHQRERWGSDHDAGKQPLDWFWLIGYLAQKAATAQMAGNHDKALHHTISTAAALANWHLAISGADTTMRPGIEPPALSAGAK